MAVAPQTFGQADTQALFIRKEVSAKGDSVVFYFQGQIFISGVWITMQPADVLANLSTEELDKHPGTHKFTISAEELTSPRYQKLVSAERQKSYTLTFGYLPEASKIEGRDTKYAKLKFVSLAPSIEEQFKEAIQKYIENQKKSKATASA